MDELSEEDKIVSRARKIQRFLSQPFFVAEQFTSIPGAYVPIEDDSRFPEFFPANDSLRNGRSTWLVPSMRQLPRQRSSKLLCHH